ncbi:MAG: type II secretion system protein [Dehalococcoidales bacterium]|nr:type II secretion system protein [Dehalococcoidales bacterium]
MKMPKRGEKGFTLIELLIVIAILGVLAAIVVPNVGRFIGSGDQEALDTERATVQAAVQALMLSEGVSSLSAYNTADSTDNATNDMTEFPSLATDIQLYGASGGNYLQSDETSYYYYVEDDGTVHGQDASTNASSTVWSPQLD